MYPPIMPAPKNPEKENGLLIAELTNGETDANPDGESKSAYNDDVKLYGDTKQFANIPPNGLVAKV